MPSCPKPFTVVSKPLRDSAKGQTCTLRTPYCERGNDTVIFAHFRGKWALGIAKKPDDTFGCYACGPCHAEEERSGPLCTDHDRLRALYETQHRMIAAGLIQVVGWNK